MTTPSRPAPDAAAPDAAAPDAAAPVAAAPDTAAPDTAASEAYLDGLFGHGMGARHSAFVSRLRNPDIQDCLHRYHELEADETWLSIEDNYLLGMTVLCALGEFGPASMFAMTLRHRGVPAERILAAVGRLEMWVGGIRAASAVGHIQGAVRRFDRDGLDAMAAWFPPPRESRS